MSALRPLLTVADVATLTGLSEYTVREAIRDRELPAMKLRGRLRITEDALTVWLDQNIIQPAPPALVPDRPRAPARRGPAPTGGYRQLARARLTPAGRRAIRTGAVA